MKIFGLECVDIKIHACKAGDIRKQHKSNIYRVPYLKDNDCHVISNITTYQISCY